MKMLIPFLFLFSIAAWADTPPPGTVKAKTYSGDGTTAIGHTGDALNVSVSGGGLAATVNQGTAGSSQWLFALPTNASLENGGYLQQIYTRLGISLPLPTGAATEATLSTMNLKMPVLGQALAAGSTPVVLTAAQLSTLTPLTTITANIGTTGGLALDNSVTALQVSQGSATSGQKGALTLGAVSTSAPTYTNATSQPLSITTTGGLRVDASGTTQPVSGTVTANAGTGTFNVDGSAHTQPVSGTFWQATQPVSGTFFQATQPVSGTVTANAGTGTLLVDASAHPQPVTGTFWQTTQPVSGTFFQATQPVSLAVAPALVASSAVIGKVGIDQTTPGTTNLVALAANQSVNLAQVAGATTSTSNGTADSGTQRVTIASNNSAIAVTPGVPAATTVKQAAITAGTSAIRLTTDAAAPSSTRQLLVAQLLSTSTANCFFGSSGVTSSSTGRGVQMQAGQVFSFSNDAGDYYVICDASTQTVFVTEQE